MSKSPLIIQTQYDQALDRTYYYDREGRRVPRHTAKTYVALKHSQVIEIAPGAKIQKVST